MVHLHRREILDITRGCALGPGPFSTHAEHIAQVPLTRELRGSLRGPAVVVLPDVHGGHARFGEPRVPVYLRGRLREPSRVRSLEVIGLDRGVLVALEVLDEKLCKLRGAVGSVGALWSVTVAAGHVLEVDQECEAFLVGNL